MRLYLCLNPLIRVRIHLNNSTGLPPDWDPELGQRHPLAPGMTNLNLLTDNLSLGSARRATN